MKRIGNKAPDWGINYGLRELWSEVMPGLWVGGTADNDTVGNARPGVERMLQDAEITKEHFDAVVTMYAWAQPVDWHVEELRWGIYDGPGGVDEAKLIETARWAFTRWQNGERVLIRCQAGLNRAALVTSLVLMMAGLTAEGAIWKIRDERSANCLFNPDFVLLIRRLEHELAA